MDHYIGGWGTDKTDENNSHCTCDNQEADHDNDKDSETKQNKIFFVNKKYLFISLQEHLLWDKTE